MRMGQGGRGKKNKMGFWNINANFLIKTLLNVLQKHHRISLLILLWRSCICTGEGVTIWHVSNHPSSLDGIEEILSSVIRFLLSA